MKTNQIEKIIIQMRNDNLNKFERNMRKIIPILPSKDSIGKHFCYCNYHRHPGIIGEDKVKKCYRRDCSYLHIYRR